MYPGQHNAIIEEDTWRKTHALLETNRQIFLSDERVASPSFLKGLLYDDAGHRMSPSHGRKGSRRYHYYISQAVLQYREHEAGSVPRVPAHPLEQVVQETVCHALEKDELTQDLARRLVQMCDRERHQKLRRIIQRVVVGRTTLRITVNPNGNPFMSDITVPNEDDAEEQSVMQLEVPFTLLPRGGRSRVMLNGSLVNMHGGPNVALVQAVSRGYQWREQLLSGRPTSVKEFAQEEGVTPRYFMRLLRVSFLAPDIIEAILNGTQPADMTLERFRSPIPLDWAAQRLLFGYPSR